MTIEERRGKLGQILDLLQHSGYIYDKAKGGVHGMVQMPPSPGTRMNCESAARIFIQLASDMGMGDLQAIYFKGGEYGYFVPAIGRLALGCQPEISTPVARGWEFDNHWRVRDVLTGQVYDPTFGTCDHSPTGILGTAMSTGLNFEMTTVYGGKYRIKRQGLRVECTELSKGPVDPKYLVSDTSFVPKPMTNLR